MRRLGWLFGSVMMTAALHGAPASADGLVPGGAAFPPGLPTQEGTARGDAAASPHAAEAPVFTMAFTPRGGIGLFAGDPTSDLDPGPRLTLNLGTDEGLGERLDRLTLKGGSSLRSGEREVRGGLVIGGALRWDEWSLGGNYARSSVLGTPADLVGASVGYGPFTARLSYGEVDRGSQENAGLWVFSTDLAAWSWLSVEGDVALQTRPETQPETVGRVGLKLSF